MTYDDLVAQSLALPDVTEWATRREIGLARGEDWMLTLKKDETVAAKVGWPAHDRLLAAYPGVFFKTPHYDGYPAILARVADLTPETAQTMLSAAWDDAPFPASKERPEL